MISKGLKSVTTAFTVFLFLMAACGSIAFAQDVDESGATSGAGQITVPLSGRGEVDRNNRLSVLPSTLKLGMVEIGDSQAGALTLTHTGNADAEPVNIEGATMFGQSASEFSTDFSGFQTLFGGESLSVNVTFTPTSPGLKSAGMRLQIAGASNPHVLLFSGISRYPLTSDLAAPLESVTLGEVLQDTAAAGRATLSNVGEAEAPAINVFSVQLSGTNAADFTVDFQPVTLYPGDTLDLDISVDTSTPGFKSALAQISHDGNNDAVELTLEATVNEPDAIPVNFSLSTVESSKKLVRPTSLHFGPDGKLYVGEMDGPIHVFDVIRNDKDSYTAELLESIFLIKEVANHNDDGTPNELNRRLMTGIYVTGTARNPVIYAASSDPRQAAGPSGTDSNLDTNSGILHRLTKVDGVWEKLDLVRGLPRSEENHVSNGLLKLGNKIYLNVGGHTNQGAPSNNFAELSEYALSAAILEIDLDMIGDTTYDLPTLDGPADDLDPFGGHDGLNQAMLVEDGPVKIFATGFRNAYDLVHTEAGHFYTWDNGPNSGWGGPPVGCLNTIEAVAGGNTYFDGLHHVTQGYYAGHPNPTRGNKENTFGGQSPIEGSANPVECDYLVPGPDNRDLTAHRPSTNGLDEYTASNFGSDMKNDLIAVSLNKTLWRVQLNDAGDTVTSKSALHTTLGQSPLDVTTQGDNEIFPGTIWVADLFGSFLFVLEPADY